MSLAPETVAISRAASELGASFVLVVAFHFQLCTRGSDPLPRVPWIMEVKK